MKVGDLVKYWALGGEVGIVVGIAKERERDNFIIGSVKVRWTDHSDSERDWYRKDELVPLLKVDDHLCRIAEG